MVPYRPRLRPGPRAYHSLRPEPQAAQGLTRKPGSARPGWGLEAGPGTSLPATFQAMMNEIFADMDDVVVVYIDDLMIFTKTDNQAEQIGRASCRERVCT